jgi:hypothetical protein
MGAVSPDGQWTLLKPFALPRVDVDVAGADIGGALPTMALGPQYSLGSNVTLGGNLGGHDTVAFGAHPDNDSYTFGVRVTF